jgi:dipeptidyl aminopeptidase/acylaminoacyl peptidase
MFNIQWAKIPKKNRNLIFYISDKDGKFDIYVYNRSHKSSKKVLDRNEGIFFFRPSHDGKSLYYLKDKAGSEKGHFVKRDIQSGLEIDLTPGSEDYFSFEIVEHLENSELFSFVASRDEYNFLYLQERKQNKVLFKSKRNIGTPIFLKNTKKLLYTRETEKHNWEVVKIDLVTYQEEILHILREELYLLDSNEKDIIVMTNDEGRYMVYNLDLESGNLNPIHRNLSTEGDYFYLASGENRHLLSHFHKAQSKLVEIRGNEIYEYSGLKGNAPLFFEGAHYLSDREICLVWEDFSQPRGLYTLNSEEKKLKPLVTGNTENTFSWKSIWFQSEDKTNIQGWISYPEKNGKKPLPFIIDIHGGPHGLVAREYNFEGNLWRKAGFGFAAVNYRGSIGFGTDFEKKIYEDIGKYEVMDVVAMRNYLVDNEYVDPSNIFITGWSWGGYVVLQTLGTHPGEFCAGVCGMGIADFVLQYEDEPASFKSVDEQNFGGTPSTNLKQYQKSSPISYVKDFQDPVLVIHGKNDARCPERQMRNFVAKMKNSNKNIEDIWLEAGHASLVSDTNLRKENFERALRFVNKHLKE